MHAAEPGPDPVPPPVDILTLADESYPPQLRLIHDPPPRLYVRGDADLLSLPQIALVGSRKASPAGLRAAEALARDLAASGLAVCSGLALGIDGAGHRGALAAGGKSTAVLGTGIDRVYPYQHRELAQELASNGCLVSEFPPGTPPRRAHFPQRNRIISGLSLGVVVVEAALPSGSLITAGTALQQGREVFALPWSAMHRGGRGCLRLIRDGAKLVAGLEDILEELGPLLRVQRELFSSPLAQAAPGIESAGLDAVLELVGYEVSSLDELAASSRLPLAQLMAGLSTLELEGLVRRCAGGYIRC